MSANDKLKDMRPKTALILLGSLLDAPSFTSRDAARVGVGASTIQHYIKQGDLERIGRGVYRATSAPSIDDFQWEDLTTAAQSVKDGAICLTSALAIYGLTEEIPRQHWIAIHNSTRHRSGPTVKVVRMRNLDLGRATINMSGLTLSIFDRERTVIDSFRYLGREAAIKALKAAFSKKGAEKIDVEKIRKYARALRVQIEPYLLAVTA